MLKPGLIFIIVNLNHPRKKVVLLVRDIFKYLKLAVLSRGWVQSLFILYFGIFSLAMLAYALYNPSYNWDMVAYVGSVKSFETSDKIAIHNYAYTELEQYVDSDTFNELTNNSTYRQILYSDPESFQQVLPWYQIRPIYTGLMYIMSRAGINIYLASHLISAVAIVAGIWIFYLTFRHYIAGTFWFSVPFFIVLNGTVEDARLSTPDGLAFLWISLLTYLFVRRSNLLYWLLPIAIIIRTGLIFLVALFLIYLVCYDKTHRVKSLIVLVTSLITYLVINKLAGNYGWATVFYLVFISDFTLNYPADAKIQISILQYVQALFIGVLDILESDAFDAFVGVFLLHTGMLLRIRGLRGSLGSFTTQRINALAAISVSYVAIHFLIFPAGYSRFFAAQYLTGLLVFLASLSRVSKFDGEIKI